MSQTDTEMEMAESEYQQVENDDLKLVPVVESIRYRRRAQSAEKKAEVLAGQLKDVQSQVESLSEQLRDVRRGQELASKLSAAGAIDVEGAVAIARARMSGDADADVDDVVEQLRKDKQYLFAETATIVAAGKTAGARDRTSSLDTALESAARKAATTGNRVDLQEYLKLRRRRA